MKPQHTDAGDMATLLTEGWGYMRVELGAMTPRVTLEMVREEFGSSKHEDADWCTCSACRAMQETVR